jgi:hypothetical protein
MGMRTGLIIAVLLALVGAFFAFRAGIHSLQVSRRKASWPERDRQRAAGWRYFGLSIILVLLSIACVSFMITGAVTRLATPASPTPYPTATATNTPTETQTIAYFPSNTPVPTDTALLTTSTPTGTATIALPPSRTPLPSDTHWATWTASVTPTSTKTRTPTPLPSVTDTRFPTWTPRPSDTRWPDPTPTR